VPPPPPDLSTQKKDDNSQQQQNTNQGSNQKNTPQSTQGNQNSSSQQQQKTKLSGNQKNTSTPTNKYTYEHGEAVEAKYHQPQSSGLKDGLGGKGNKSPCPRDVQEALDKSIGIEESKHRVSIQDEKFVVLRKTAEHQYHGYVVSWKDLPDKMKKALKIVGKVNDKGKIL
jgi:hypothetical protein